MKAVKEFFKGAFEDMAESAKAQHEVDKANFQAAKTEAKANWEEAKVASNPKVRQAAMQSERDAAITQANQRIEEAQKRIDTAKNPHLNKGKEE